ncbi:uncharacterized protein DMAD_13425 [Drosophila madeirensis]|uniref:Uncharacterized protein n=2 Tax=Drosophila madeirensis TaxID=30013 RepID=A0AAU9FJT4_DROMD
MSEKDATDGDPGQKRLKNNENDAAGDEVAQKSLTMSFMDWKKCKEALKPDANAGGGQRRKQWSQLDHRSYNSGGCGGNGNNQWNNQDRNNVPPLSRPPPLPLQLMSMGLGFGGNFNAGPPPNMPNCNMGNMGMGMGGPGPGPGPGPCRNNGHNNGGNNQGPLQPPPFWDDMMSPNQRPPPIQPPMPKCPSLWNLLPKDKGQRQNRTNQTPNKKYKLNNSSKNVAKDTYQMPPPPPPPPSDPPTDADANDTKDGASTANGGQPSKKKRGGAFIQINGQWIQKPEAPLPLEDSPPGTKEDRQRQWKEYRQAMKPFKNREFHNWKRTVQRLGKLPREELDEQQLERLQKAEEYIGAHKAMLTIKHAERWVQQDNQKSDDSDKTQVYVRRQVNPSYWDKLKQKQSLANNGFQPEQLDSEPATPFVGTGRAIKGGFPTEAQTQVPTQPQPQLQATPMGQYNSQHQQRENNYSNTFGMVSNSTSTSRPNSSYYSNYSNSFVKGDMLLPP